MATCIICANPIHPERLAALPRTKTCSKTCSGKRQVELRRAATYRLYQRRRAERALQEKE